MDIDRIKTGLKQPGKSQAGLARALRVNPSAVNRILTGGRQVKAKEIPIIEGYLGTNGKPAASAHESKRPTIEAGHDKLPVLGMLPGGDDGSLAFSGEIIDRVPRPPSLAEASNAYGLFVPDAQMEPRYHQGELIYVHPGRPVTAGCYVLVKIRSASTGAPRAMVARLAKQSPLRLVLEQLNPPKTSDVQVKDVIAIHRIVGSGE